MTSEILRFSARSASFFVFDFRELAVVVGAARAVAVADLGDRDHADRVVQFPVAFDVHAMRGTARAALVVVQALSCSTRHPNARSGARPSRGWARPASPSGSQVEVTDGPCGWGS